MFWVTMGDDVGSELLMLGAQKLLRIFCRTPVLSRGLRGINR